MKAKKTAERWTVLETFTQSEDLAYTLEQDGSYWRILGHGKVDNRRYKSYGKPYSFSHAFGDEMWVRRIWRRMTEAN